MKKYIALCVLLVPLSLAVSAYTVTEKPVTAVLVVHDYHSGSALLANLMQTDQRDVIFLTYDELKTLCRSAGNSERVRHLVALSALKPCEEIIFERPKLQGDTYLPRSQRWIKDRNLQSNLYSTNFTASKAIPVKV